jgi:phosphoglycerate dehydrogenase-like enzyme
VQSVATGIELIDPKALPRGVAICNAFGHETAIAEYVMMAMLVWSHRFLEIEGEFRARSSWRPSWVQSGAPHGEIFGKTVGIVGLGRVGHEVARRAAAFGCRIVAANRSPRAAGDGVERLYPLGELDAMLPACDFVVLATALGPETERLIDARRPRRGGDLSRAPRARHRRRRARRVVAVPERGRTRAPPLAPAVSRIAERHHDAALLGLD